VIVALAGPWPVGPSTIDGLAASATVVVDLSVPAAVPPNVPEILGARLVTADALARPDADGHRSSPGDSLDASSARSDALIDSTVTQFLEWEARAAGSVGRGGTRAARRPPSAKPSWPRCGDAFPTSTRTFESRSRG